MGASTTRPADGKGAGSAPPPARASTSTSRAARRTCRRRSRSSCGPIRSRTKQTKQIISYEVRNYFLALSFQRFPALQLLHEQALDLVGALAVGAQDVGGPAVVVGLVHARVESALLGFER